MNQPTPAAAQPAMKWEDAEAVHGEDFDLSAEAAEVPLACNLGEECTACQ